MERRWQRQGTEVVENTENWCQVEGGCSGAHSTDQAIPAEPSLAVATAVERPNNKAQQTHSKVPEADRWQLHAEAVTHVSRTAATGRQQPSTSFSNASTTTGYCTWTHLNCSVAQTPAENSTWLVLGLTACQHTEMIELGQTALMH